MQSDVSPTAILARVEERLRVLGISAAAAGRSAGGAHLIPNLRKGSVPSLDNITKLAAVLETTPAFLAFGIEFDDEDLPVELVTPRNFPPLGSLPIIGEFAAGLWHEVDDAIDESPYAGIAAPPDPAYPAAHQFAGIVKGTSVNRVAPDGSVVSCLDVQKARIRPKDGDLVAVEQTRHGGHERMRTIKRLKHTADGIELWPDSDDPKWSARGPIRVNRGDEDDGTTVVILGVVTWVHLSLDRSQRYAED